MEESKIEESKMEEEKEIEMTEEEWQKMAEDRPYYFSKMKDCIKTIIMDGPVPTPEKWKNGGEGVRVKFKWMAPVYNDQGQEGKPKLQKINFALPYTRSDFGIGKFTRTKDENGKDLPKEEIKKNKKNARTIVKKYANTYF